MKKQEAIDIINKILGDHSTKDDDLASTILDVLEQVIGMSPPEYDVVVTKEFLGQSLIYKDKKRGWETT